MPLQKPSLTTGEQTVGAPAPRALSPDPGSVSQLPQVLAAVAQTHTLVQRGILGGREVPGKSCPPVANAPLPPGRTVSVTQCTLQSTVGPGQSWTSSETTPSPALAALTAPPLENAPQLITQESPSQTLLLGDPT